MKNDLFKQALAEVPMERVLAAPVPQLAAAIVPSLPSVSPRRRVPQEEWAAGIAARLAERAEPIIYWPMEVIEEPNAATCKHGLSRCARCGINVGDVAHTTVGGRGSVARALGRKGAR